MPDVGGTRTPVAGPRVSPTPIPGRRSVRAPAERGGAPAILRPMAEAPRSESDRPRRGADRVANDLARMGPVRKLLLVASIVLMIGAGVLAATGVGGGAEAPPATDPAAPAGDAGGGRSGSSGEGRGGPSGGDLARGFDGSGGIDLGDILGGRGGSGGGADDGDGGGDGSSGDGPASGGDGTGGSAAGGPAERSWSPVVFRLGFSFFAGFCIAYALRAFLEMALLVIGLVMLGLFGLEYAGIVTVEWSLVEGHYASVRDWLAGQTESFTAFVKGSLPSAASAGAGLVAGFRRI